MVNPDRTRKMDSHRSTLPAVCKGRDYEGFFVAYKTGGWIEIQTPRDRLRTNL